MTTDAAGAPVGDEVDGVRITGVSGVPAGGSSPRVGGSPGPDGGAGGERPGTVGLGDVSVTADPLPETGGPADTGRPRCTVTYTVTNPEKEPFTYTITFGFHSEREPAGSRTPRAVVEVEAGGTLRRTVEESAPDLGFDRVGISDVKRVPTAQAPAVGGPCPASGLRLTADDGTAAAGLRVVGLRLENCGSHPYSVEGYPVLDLLDSAHKPVEGIRIVEGGEGIALVTGFDDPPRPVTLKPGEAATAGLMWRNTTEFGDAVTVPYVRVRARDGADPVMVTPHLDLGTTGALGVSAWREANEQNEGDEGNGDSAPAQP
ncbi:DUF4232 domain-containing protein [Streptomyces tagetis]|uniref:DUF4232 domain-containing protein n=1 Tax=Streptomyces tagetis TaxID=2820809 RepID=UPI0027DC62E0|nr:DUF4232 domain-containing protein [Streptomyces sp. RG38]